MLQFFVALSVAAAVVVFFSIKLRGLIKKRKKIQIDIGTRQNKNNNLVASNQFKLVLNLELNVLVVYFKCRNLLLTYLGIFET